MCAQLTKIARKVKTGPSAGMTVTPRTGGNGITPQGDESKPILPETQEDEQPSSSKGDSSGPTGHVIENVEEIIQELTIEDNEDETKVTDEDCDENGEPIFPLEHLARLDDMVNRPKWIIPVLPKAELEVLLDASIRLAKKGLFLISVLSL